MTAGSGRVLGVDPGSLRSGWAVLEGTADRPRLIACGEIALGAARPFAERLATLHARTASIAAKHRPEVAAVEAPFHGVSARSALQLAHARGVVLAALAAAGVPVVEYAPATVKKSVTGSGRADKAQVQAMVARLVPGGASVGGADVADAVAAALCHLAALAPAAVLARSTGARRPR